MRPSHFDIADLVDDLQPVRPLSLSKGFIAPILLTAAMIAVAGWMLGFRSDLMRGELDPMFLIRAGTLLLLGLGAGHAVLSMASPSVGKANNGWHMAVASAMLFPLSALIVAATGKTGVSMADMPSGMICLRMSMIGGLAVAIPMVWRLRQGAPTSPERAGWLTGIASGGLGAFAYGFHCPYSNIVYIGIFYGLAVAACAVIGRLIVPRLIRW
jgi:hypothetical protein